MYIKFFDEFFAPPPSFSNKILGTPLKDGHELMLLLILSVYDLGHESPDEEIQVYGSEKL
jgi:hypothetical protein